jgi:hypothetical protein
MASVASNVNLKRRQKSSPLDGFSVVVRRVIGVAPKHSTSSTLEVLSFSHVYDRHRPGRYDRWRSGHHDHVRVIPATKNAADHFQH